MHARRHVMGLSTHAHIQVHTDMYIYFYLEQNRYVIDLEHHGWEL